MSASPAGDEVIDQLARRHGVSVGAVEALTDALTAGGGRQAQFSHPDLGGMGQWSSGGMLMIGDMFNHELKSRVAALCSEIAGLVRSGSIGAAEPTSRSGHQWPAELGQPSSAGAQNGARYAVFPARRRLAIERDGAMTIYDTGDLEISGASQQQGSDQSLSFTSQKGRVLLDDLRRVDGTDIPTASAKTETDHLATLERLSDLARRGIITAEEFTAKKAELLARL